MKRLLVIFFLLAWAAHGNAQVTITPAFPTADEEITIVYDATAGTTGLVGASAVFMHSGVVLSSASGTGWSNVQGTWGSPSSVGQMTSLGNNKWQIKITPRSYFNVPAGTRIYRIGMVFRNAGPCGGFAGNNTPCKEGKTVANGDFFIDLYESGQYHVRFTTPVQFPIFKNTGETLSIAAEASQDSELTLQVNGETVASVSDARMLGYTHTITETSGSSTVTLLASNGTDTRELAFQYIIRTPPVTEARPSGIIDGINYSDDASKVTLCLWAPGKTSVYAVGDFSDWHVQSQYQMKKDGEHFWIEIAGITPGEEYGFQYLVDESLRIADPYADKILDPDDRFIPAAVYPGLKPYPEKALHERWYFNRVSVFQTNQEPYVWKDQNYTKPPREKLVVYELLIRDFFGSDQRSYQNLIDTLSYFKRLGVNAIELMPIMEFNGNDSWGYNPTFMFAPDKYYGPKNKLKEFIDRCHQEGIAVILDITMNHHDMPNPYVMLDFDFAAGRPSANNKWFNPSATHPFNVFFDMNHESAYTKKYLDTVNYYWLKEYHIDGYRFDLSKGFTQRNTPNDVNAWSAYDASRIALLKRMADKIWAHSPDAYIILEHFAANTEEKELAEYRAQEGKGMMLWGNMHGAYSSLSKGNGSDISGAYHASRTWTVPHLVSYMESHDEERLMVDNLQNGKSSGSYNIKSLNTALDRIKAASVCFYTIPGPKMLWQFGELGYDQSINRCPDGTINNDCRVSPKPVLWEYRDVAARASLWTHIADLIHLRNTYDVFTKGTATISSGSSLQKSISIRNSPFTTIPADASQMNVQIVANFDVVSKSLSVNFPHTGIWYDYYQDDTYIDVISSSYTFTLQPGEYRLYTDFNLKGAPVMSTDGLYPEVSVTLYPNPASYEVIVHSPGVQVHEIVLVDLQGKRMAMEFSKDSTERRIDVRALKPGMYIVEMNTTNGVVRRKLIKR